MNKRKRKHLMEKMIGILLLGLFLALLLFLLIFFMGNGALNRYFESSMYRRNVSKETIAMFQEYVSRHHLAASDTERIREWAKENHIGYFTISRKRMLLYDNYYALPVALDRTKSEQLHYTWQYFQEVSFTDGNADVFIYVNRERKYYILVDVAAALCGVLVWIGVFAFGVSGYVRYIRQLSGEVAKLEDGLWSVDFTIKGEDELTDLARGLEHMKTVLLEKEEKERNMKKAQNKLVLGMAHDLRTPLTALMAYLEIIKREPEHDKVKLYVKKTVGKAIQIKNLSDQLFEFFLINSGQQPQMEKSESIAFVMEDYCSELCNVLQTNGYTVTLGWKQWEEVKISVCYDYIGRIMNNLLSNLLKYADKTKEILLDMGICQDEFFFSIMNAAANKEQDHRGTGIGVHNIEIMMEQMQGRCEEECGEESYRICLYFPVEKSENS